MPLKKYTEFLPLERCSFCKLQETDILYGPIYKCKQKFQQKCIMVHYYCLLMASKIEQNGRDSQGILGFFPKDIIKELTRGNTQRCCYCNGLGATVHCIHKDCDKIFHLPCGIKKGTIHQFFDLFDSYCHSHRPKQNIPSAILRQVKDSCVICSINIDKKNKYDSLWPSCCKPTVLIHRKCIQTMACNAGYYFKCPLCNNAEVFKKEMQRIGIYIPEQDASWELEPNAYGELRVRGSGCESEECVCPKGRGFTHKNSAWQLELCQVCGGNGVHLGCSKKWDKNLGFKLNWFCNICKPVYLENKASRTPEHAAVKDEEPTINSEESSSSTEDSSVDSEISVDIIGPSTNDDNLLRPSITEPTKEPKVNNNNLKDEDDVIIVSEGEELPEPPRPALPSMKLTSEQDDTSCETSSLNSDDEIEILNIMTSKRRNIEPPTTPRKRLRTAPWAPLLNKTGNGLLERIQQTSKGVSDSHSATPTASFQIANPTFTQNLYTNPIAGPSSAPCTFEEPPFISTSKENASDLLYTKNETVKSQYDVMVHSGTKVSQPVAKQRNSLSEQTEGTNLPSNIGIKLNEVSINRIVSKFPCNNETIELSSDEECITQPPRDTSIRKKEASMMVQESNVDKFLEVKKSLSLSASNINSFRNSLGKKESKNFEDWINSQIIGKKNLNSKDKIIKQEINISNTLIKKTSSHVPLQVILSSDEEEEPAGTAMKTSHSTGISNSTPASINNKNHFENRMGCPTISSNNNKNKMFPIKKDTIQGVEMPVKRKETTEFNEQKYLPAKRSTNLSMTSTSRSISSDSVEEVTTPILHNFLSGNNFSKDNSIKPDILIVSDDDDDDIKVENVSYGEKNLSSYTKIPKRNVKQVFSKEELIEKRPGCKMSRFSSSVSSNEGIGVITGVMTLSSASHLFSSEDDFFSNDPKLMDSKEGSLASKNEENGKNVQEAANIETVPKSETNSQFLLNIKQAIKPSYVDSAKNVDPKIEYDQQLSSPSSNSLIQNNGFKLNIEDYVVSSTVSSGIVSEGCASPVQSETKISEPSETLSLGTNACDDLTAVSSTTGTSFPQTSLESVVTTNTNCDISPENNSQPEL